MAAGGEAHGGVRMDTLAVHGGERRPGPEGSVVFPIYQGTVFEDAPETAYHDLRYLRLSSTPSQAYLHDKLAALEGAEAALATSSGMAAISTVLLSLLRAGDHLLVSDCLYGGTHGLLSEHAGELGWDYTPVDPGRPESWDAALTDRSRVFLVETITNPLVRVGRLRELVAFARAHGLTTVIDNTFASPVNFRPLAWGFDLSISSATKYLNGHSDIVAGTVAGSAAAVERVRARLAHSGAALDPHAGFLLARGMKTVALRVRAAGRNAAALAGVLAEHPHVAEVNYPGLPGHPDHGRAAELLDGFGGMLSFRPTGGLPAARALLEALRLPYLGPSLGGVETLVTRPATSSHAGMSPADRAAAGISDELIRVSCGIEDSGDLLADFENALAGSQ